MWLEKLVIDESDALLIIDVQNDFIPGGALAVSGGDDIVHPVNLISERMSKKGNRVILTQDWHPKGHASFASTHPGKNPFDPIDEYGIGPVLWPDHCIQGEKGSEFHNNLNINQASLIIRKGYNPIIDSYSAIQENDKKTKTGLSGYLNSSSIRRLLICGLALDYCVYYTAIDAVADGFEVVIIHDLTRGIDENSVKEAMKIMESKGVNFINLSNIEE